MSPTDFPESNSAFKAPADFEDSQVATIPAYAGVTRGGSCDGAPLVVVAWKPTVEEIDAMKEGAPIFLSCIGGLPPHFLSMSFMQATHPQ